MNFAEHNMLLTIAFMRIFILVAWIPYFIIERRRPERYVFILVLCLLIPNIITMYMGLVGP